MTADETPPPPFDISPLTCVVEMTADGATTESRHRSPSPRAERFHAGRDKKGEGGRTAGVVGAVRWEIPGGGGKEGCAMKPTRIGWGGRKMWVWLGPSARVVNTWPRWRAWHPG